MNMICGEEVHEIGPGELVHIPRNTRHGIHITEGPAKFFAVKSPRATARWIRTTTRRPMRTR